MYTVVTCDGSMGSNTEMAIQKFINMDKSTKTETSYGVVSVSETIE